MFRNQRGSRGGKYSFGGTTAEDTQHDKKTFGEFSPIGGSKSEKEAGPLRSRTG